MLPIVVWFFGKVSVIGILVNLLAVPFLGLVVVPLDMLAGVVSWLPVVGDWLSQIIWSLLTTLLNVFHLLLNQLINMGVANQSFFALSQTQLALCLLIALLGLLKGLLPRMLILPLAILLILLPLQHPKCPLGRYFKTHQQRIKPCHHHTHPKHQQTTR